MRSDRTKETRPDLIGLPTSFVSARLIREAVTDNVKARQGSSKNDKTALPEATERWIEKLIENAKAEGRLMTDQQYTDWAMRRELAPGDRVKYIGADREETSQDGGVYVRPHGQIGTISEVQSSETSSLITMWPDDPVEVQTKDGRVAKTLVTLTVRSKTPGWLDLERINL